MANPGAAVGAVIPHAGTPVSMRAEKYMKLLCYVIRYHVRVSRTFDIAGMTLAIVRSYESFREGEKDHEDLEAPTLNDKDWPRTMESIQNWLRGCHGQTHIPLSYVVRKETAVPLEADDPTTNYTSKLDELINRAPIIDAIAADGTITYNGVYLQDRETVWVKMDELTRDHASRTYIREAARTRDGRMAYELLYQHYLGANNVDMMSSKAEHTLSTLSYNGESRHWDFEKYVRKHVEQHLILEELTRHGYAGLDERSKVRHLINGIKTDKLETVKTQVLSTPALRSDFKGVVNLYQDMIRQKNLMNKSGRDSHIAAVTTGGGKEVVPDMSIEDRYYNNKEFKNLTPEQRAGLTLKRQQRGAEPGKRGRARGKDKKGNKKGGLDISRKSIKALATTVERAIKKVSFNKDEESGETEGASESSDDDSGKATKKQKAATNRDNPALKRGSKKAANK